MAASLQKLDGFCARTKYGSYTTFTFIFRAVGRSENVVGAQVLMWGNYFPFIVSQFLRMMTALTDASSPELLHSLNDVFYWLNS